jgi:hypothetical protein
MKRGRLYACARREGFNVLAMGQHLDDLAESFLMSVFHNGFLRTMKANYTVQCVQGGGGGREGFLLSWVPVGHYMGGGGGVKCACYMVFLSSPFATITVNCRYYNGYLTTFTCMHNTVFFFLPQKR